MVKLDSKKLSKCFIATFLLSFQSIDDAIVIQLEYSQRDLLSKWRVLPCSYTISLKVKRVTYFHEVTVGGYLMANGGGVPYKGVSPYSHPLESILYTSHHRLWSQCGHMRPHFCIVSHFGVIKKIFNLTIINSAVIVIILIRQVGRGMDSNIGNGNGQKGCQICGVQGNDDECKEPPSTADHTTRYSYRSTSETSPEQGAPDVPQTLYEVAGVGAAAVAVDATDAEQREADDDEGDEDGAPHHLGERGEELEDPEPLLGFLDHHRCALRHERFCEVHHRRPDRGHLERRQSDVGFLEKLNKAYQCSGRKAKYIQCQFSEG